MTLPRRLFLKLLLVAALFAPSAGCTRKFFRERADRDVEKVITEKNVFEPWRVEQWHVYPDPRARFADPFNPDRPPMPPDDPAAQFLSPNPQRPGKAGIGKFEGTGYLDLLAAWDAMNRANEPPKLPEVNGPQQKNTAEMASSYGVRPVQYKEPAPDAPPAPAADACLPGDGQTRPFLLNLEQACELSLINSRDFQTQRENLYLTALPVTLQRFSFAAQLFALGTTSFESSGAETINGEGQRFIGSARGGFTKLFPSGATLLAQLANSFVFDVTNGNPAISVSTLTASLVQPLLQGGGRAVTLENLTQSERDLLYQIRAYARFRKQFYVQVAGGRGGGGGGGAFLDPSLGAIATAFGPSNGYLPTAQRAAFLDVSKQNVVQLQSFLRRFEAFAEGGQIPQLQVDQVKQTLLEGQSQVINDELQLQNALDNFKIQLGMPPVVNLELDQSALKPIYAQLERFQSPINQFQGLVERVDAEFAAMADATRLRARLAEVAASSDLVRGTTFPQRFRQEAEAVAGLNDAQLTERLSALRENRRRALAERTALESQERPVPPELNARVAAFEAQIRFASYEQSLREYEREPWKQMVNPTAAETRQKGMFAVVSNRFESLLIDARNQRFDIVQRQWPELPRICINGVDLMATPPETAFAEASRTALTNRLDLMNERANLVDQWRQIAVRANSLLGVLNVGYSVNSGSPAGAGLPFDFNSSRTTQRVTMDYELPLVRRAERNLYRAGLINFQRARRGLQAAEDNILNDVRSEIRQLRVLAETYKIQQQQLYLDYNQVEQSLEEFGQPTSPSGAIGGPIAPPTPGQTTALTQQLLNAQGRLVRNQRNLFTTWINYLTLRMELFFDLEILPLDARGVWNDEHAYRDCDPSCRPDGAVAPREQLGEPRPGPSADDRAKR